MLLFARRPRRALIPARTRRALCQLMTCSTFKYHKRYVVSCPLQNSDSEEALTRWLAFTRYCFTSKLYCGSPSPLAPPPPICKAYPIAVLLHVYCAIYTLPPTPILYANHNTILVMAISCKGSNSLAATESRGGCKWLRLIEAVAAASRRCSPPVVSQEGASPTGLISANQEFESHGGRSEREWFAAGSVGGRHPVVSPVRTPVLLLARRELPPLD